MTCKLEVKKPVFGDRSKDFGQIYLGSYYMAVGDIHSPQPGWADLLWMGKYVGLGAQLEFKNEDELKAYKTKCVDIYGKAVYGHSDIRDYHTANFRVVCGEGESEHHNSVGLGDILTSDSTTAEMSVLRDVVFRILRHHFLTDALPDLYVFSKRCCVLI